MGRVNTITVQDTGFGYDSAPRIVIGPPQAEAGGARASLVMSGGSISRIVIDDPGNYYQDPLYATIFYDSGDSATSVRALVNIDSEGGVRSVVTPSINSSGNESITFDSATGTPADFTARAIATIDASGQVDGVTITFGGGGYKRNPAIEFEAIYTEYSPGDSATQVLSDGTQIKGEIASYTDQDGILQLVNVGASDGKYHNFVVGRDITFGATNKRYTRTVLSVGESTNLTKNEQNTGFETFADDIIDFSEGNPFGEVT